MNQEELRKLMDCCQPVGQDKGPDEAAEPEMAALYQTLAENPQARDQFQAIQAWDSAIGRAMRNVPVPEGLVDRLMAALGQSESGTESRSVTPAGVSRGSWWNSALQPSFSREIPTFIAWTRKGSSFPT